MLTAKASPTASVITAFRLAFYFNPVCGINSHTWTETCWISSCGTTVFPEIIPLIPRMITFGLPATISNMALCFPTCFWSTFHDSKKKNPEDVGKICDVRKRARARAAAVSESRHRSASFDWVPPPPEMDRISHLPRWPHSDLMPKVNSVRLIRLAISYVLLLKQHHFHMFVAPN